MNFTETMTSLPYRPSSEEGRGFLPPIVRSLGHILYLVTHVQAKGTTDEQIKSELTAARDHLMRVDPNIPALSTAARTEFEGIRKLVALSLTEYPTWDAATRSTNIRNIANRFAQFMADLDRELVGIRNSDPGSSL